MSTLPRAARLYLLVMWSGAAFALGSIIASYATDIVSQVPFLLLWSVIFCVADYFEVAIEAGDGNPARMTVTDAITIFLVTVAGVLGVLIVAVGTLITEVIRRRAWYRILFNVASRSIGFVAIWLAFDFLN